MRSRAKVRKSVLFGEVNYDRIRSRMNELNKEYDISHVAIDRWNATQLATQLDGDGFQMVAFGQGYASMSAPTKLLEEVVLSKRLRHGGHPVLRWMAGNVSIEQDAADNWKPSKKKSCERIDGIVALIMALDLASKAGEFRSIYEMKGQLVL
jgi:phage terminase large subunit-like protein